MKILLVTAMAVLLFSLGGQVGYTEDQAENSTGIADSKQNSSTEAKTQEQVKTDSTDKPKPEPKSSLSKYKRTGAPDTVDTNKLKSGIRATAPISRGINRNFHSINNSVRDMNRSIIRIRNANRRF